MKGPLPHERRIGSISILSVALLTFAMLKSFITDQIYNIGSKMQNDTYAPNGETLNLAHGHPTYTCAG
jgi:hypothetical protein